MSIIYGPVPSRRLGFSLGVDIVPFKTCTLDCIYCQLGRTTLRTVRRREYIGKKDVLKEIRKCLRNHKFIDYITFAGSGEPTLNPGIGGIIAGIKEMTDTPVAVLTNGTLLYRRDVRRDLLGADLVVPSLDSATVRGFGKINRPYSSLDVGRIIDGIVKFRREYKGKLWLEIMFVKGYNDTDAEIDGLRKAVKAIKPDRVHLNTVVRPPAEEFAGIVGKVRMKNIAKKIGKECDIICDVKWKNSELFIDDLRETMMDIIKRRPVTVRDLSLSLGVKKGEVVKNFLVLEKLGMIKVEKKNNKTFLKEKKNG